MRDRDEEFSTFFASEAERLRRLAFFLTGDLEGAADLAQDALAATYRKWKKVEDPGPYARATLVNLCKNHHRRRSLERWRMSGSDGVAGSHATRVDEALAMAAALRVLPAAMRAVVVLRYYEDLPEAEISRILDRPLGTVKSDLFRALQRLKPLLSEREVS